MFESVKQDGRSGGVVFITSLLVSLIVHAVIICLLVVIPLVFFNVLQAQDLLTFLIEPPAPPVQPPPPSPPAKAARGVRQGPMTTMYQAPRTIPDGIPPPDPEGYTPLDPGLVIDALGGLISSSQQGGMGKGIDALLKDPVLVLEQPKRPAKQSPPPVRVGVLEPSKLTRKVNPVYPQIAAKARVSGNVILEAVVDEEGSVTALKVLSGHPFLVDAAVQAVKQWRYSPTVLNGEPVPVIATITVVFRLE